MCDSSAWRALGVLFFCFSLLTQQAKNASGMGSDAFNVPEGGKEMITPTQLQAIKNITKIHCVPHDRIQGLIESGIFELLLRSDVPIDIFSEAAKNGSLRRLLRLDYIGEEVSVNYALTVEQMISSGKYFSIKELRYHSVTIPPHGRALDEIDLFLPEIIEFPTGKTLSEAEDSVRGAGMRFATAYELLAFASKFPNEQLHAGAFGIIALGTTLHTRNPYGEHEESPGYLTASAKDYSTSVYEGKKYKRTLDVTTERWVQPHVIGSNEFLAVREVNKTSRAKRIE